jgi:acyl carrier protein
MSSSAHSAAPGTRRLAPADIESWMVTKLADALKVPREEIDIDAAFTDFGLDSVAGLQLTGELETMVGRPLEATLLYEYPTIATLSRYLGR